MITTTLSFDSLSIHLSGGLSFGTNSSSGHSNRIFATKFKQDDTVNFTVYFYLSYVLITNHWITFIFHLPNVFVTEFTVDMWSKVCRSHTYHLIDKERYHSVCNLSLNIFFLIFNLSFQQNIVVSGGWDNTIQIWDLRVGTKSLIILGSPLSTLQISK